MWASEIYYGLFALQHRGQESCGIAVSDTEGPKGKVNAYKGMGLCNEVFTPDILEGLHGNIGVDMCVTPTAGSSTRENAHHVVLNYVKGTLASSTTETWSMRRNCEESWSTAALFSRLPLILRSLRTISQESEVRTSSVEEAVANAMKKIKGAYSLVIIGARAR